MSGFFGGATATPAGIVLAARYNLADEAAADWLSVGGSVGGAAATINGSGASALATDGSTGLVFTMSSGFQTVKFTISDWLSDLSIYDRLFIAARFSLVSGGNSNFNAVELKMRNAAGNEAAEVHNRYNGGTTIRVRETVGGTPNDGPHSVGAFQTWLGLDVTGWSARPFCGTTEPTPSSFSYVSSAIRLGAAGPTSTTDPMNRSTDTLLVTCNTDGGAGFTATWHELVFYVAPGTPPA